MKVPGEDTGSMRTLQHLGRQLGDLLGDIAVLLAFLHTDRQSRSKARSGGRPPLRNA
jgi:hypothetical protein